jgi:hypothetical protein
MSIRHVYKDSDISCRISIHTSNSRNWIDWSSVPNCSLNLNIPYEAHHGYKQKLQSDQKVPLHLMITIQKVTSHVQNVPRQSTGIYWHAEPCSRRPCSVQHGPQSEWILWWPSSYHQLCGDFLDCNRQVHRDFLITLYKQFEFHFYLRCWLLVFPGRCIFLITLKCNYRFFGIRNCKCLFLRNFNVTTMKCLQPPPP